MLVETSLDTAGVAETGLGSAKAKPKAMREPSWRGWYRCSTGVPCPSFQMFSLLLEVFLSLPSRDSSASPQNSAHQP